MLQTAMAATWANTPRRDGTTRRRATPASGGDPTATPDRGAPSPAPIRPRGLRNMGIETDMQPHLFVSLELCDISRVRKDLTRVRPTAMKAFLLRPTKSTEFRLRTPLMAAAATGDIAIFKAVMDAVNELFSSTYAVSGMSRDAAMHEQLELSDLDGRTLLMHATKDIGVFSSVTGEISPRQARKILQRKDARGMTFLMHAASAGEYASTFEPPSPSCSDHEDEDCQHAPTGLVGMARTEDSLPVSYNCQDQDDPSSRMLCVDPRVPLMKGALDFAKKILWMPEYRMLVTSKDMWERSILEHSVASGREHVFEACFNAVRKDVFDKEIDTMLETAESEDGKSDTTAMTAALKSKGGQRVASLFAKKAKALKRDVALRAEASTVASKIQSFIPGNLIVIFQLLLPEFSEIGSDPLILLLVLCGIAPFWAWGASLVVNRDPERKNTLARHTFARYFLSVPAMFFWGVGTSKIGSASFGWGDTASASALAVATIVIPALDSFFTGQGARRCWSKTIISTLDLSAWIRKKTSSCKKKKTGGARRPSTDNEVIAPFGSPA